MKIDMDETMRETRNSALLPLVARLQNALQAPLVDLCVMRERKEFSPLFQAIDLPIRHCYIGRPAPPLAEET